MRKLLVVAVLFVAGFASGNTVAAACAGFVDVDSASGFCASVAWVKSRGITLGCTDASHYCPNDPVTRLQMAAFMYRLGFQNTFLSGGNGFGTTAVLGTTDNNDLELRANGAAALRLQPGGGESPNVVGGSSANSVVAFFNGQTIGGGGRASSDCYDPVTMTLTKSCANVLNNDYATVSGGLGNVGHGLDATVGGGFSSLASGDYSTIGGGYGNWASGGASTIAGGESNVASGPDSMITGGYANVAGGPASVAVGSVNVASGDYAVAVGHSANVTSVGSFVYCDGTGTCNSIVNREFIAAASGGIGLYTNAAYTTGCHIPSGGGAWSCSSSRDVKTGFAEVDPRGVLDKLVRLPLSTWQFITEKSGARHLGPVAQDFWSAFGLGADDRSISTVDASGVAFAAIQGLYAELKERDATISELRGELTELRDRMSEVDSLRRELAALRNAIAAATRGATVAVQAANAAP